MKKMTRVKKKRIRRRRFLRIVLLIVILFITLRLLRQSSYFNIKSIDIKGNKLVKKDFIEDNIDIKENENIFNISVLRAKRDIKDIVYVKDVKVNRKYPNKINIEILEREEIIQLKIMNKYIILDKDGIILNIIDKKKNNILSIEGIKMENNITGENIGNKINEYIEDIETEKFVENCMETNLINILSVIKLENVEKIEIITKEDKLIEFGDISNSEYKLDLLKEIFNYIKKEDIEYTKIIMNKGENPVIVTEKVGG